LLEKNSGNVSQCAVQAGMSRQGLHKLLKKHGVNASDFRP
jgi:two-component system response regulator AtoC